MGGIFDFIGSIFAAPLGFIMQWCYQLVNGVLGLPVAYVFAIFLFTLVTKALLFPLSLKQQRSSAVMQAYQPLVNEINKKYADNPQKKQEEMAKLQKEYGYSPMAGCMPLLVQFPILFGLIEVVYNPLKYMLRIPAEIVEVFKSVAELQTGESLAQRTIETTIIEQIKSSSAQYLAADVSATGVSKEELAGFVSRIENLDMTIGSINLWDKPGLEWSWMLIIPVISIATIIISTLITQWATRGRVDKNKQTQTTNFMMIAFSTVMFGWMSFSLPAAFGLYWSISNVVIIGQSMILRKIVNADTIREEAAEKIAEKKRQQKEAKTVKVKDKTGKVEQKELAPDELARYRLQKAREQDEKRYAFFDEVDGR